MLGEAWFKATQACLEYRIAGLSAVSVWKGTKMLTLKARYSHVSKSAESSPVLSAMQFKKRLKHDCFWFMGMLSWDEDEEFDDDMGNRKARPEASDSSGSEDTGLIPAVRLERILQKRKKVFPDKLPGGLPPDRGVQHTIPDLHKIPVQVPV